MEDSPSGLWRTLGKRVGVTASRVRISYPPPGLEPRKPLKSFGFRGFALIPPDCWFPRVPSVSTPLAPTRRACHISEPTIPKTPSSLRPPRVRHRSPTASHVSRQWADSSPFMFSAQFFPFWFATIPDARRAARCAPCGPAQREGPPGPPPTNATRTHTGAMKVHSNRRSTP